MIFKMWDIKEYKQLTKICLYKGDDIISSVPVDELFKFLNSGVKFINLDGKIINISDVRFAEPYAVDGIEAFILSQSKDIQVSIRERAKQKTERIWRGFDSIEEIQNFINNKLWWSWT